MKTKAQLLSRVTKAEALMFWLQLAVFVTVTVTAIVYGSAGTKTNYLAPTVAPTFSPTGAPTDLPTANPTVSPTAPTPAPVS